MKNIVTKSLFIKIVLLVFLLGIIGTAAYFSYDFYQKKSVSHINNLSIQKVKDLKECKLVFNSDFQKLSENKYFLKDDFESSLSYCKKAYDLEKIILDESSCLDFLGKTNDFFEKNYSFLDNLQQKREECASKYFSPNFSVSSYFNIYNNFKTRLVLSDISNFYYSANSINPSNEKYFDYQKEAKDFLRKFIFIDGVEIKNEDITIGNREIYIDLDLKPKTRYLAKYVSNINSNKKILKEFSFKTPENKYFGFRVVNPVTLYTENNLPKFEVLDFNSGKEKANLKVCRILEENYSKLEVFRKTKDKAFALKYFSENIEKFNDDCEKQEVSLDTKKENSLNKIPFSFDNYLKDKTGLFFVSFENKDDIEFNSKLNYPVFFGKVNSHIMMKLSKSGDTFFFVNDLKTGKGLENQEIFVYFNDFVEATRTWNDKNKSYDEKYDFGKNTFSEAISLGKTDKYGVLKVNLKEKFKDNHIFDRTFENYGEDSYEAYKTFFIKSVGENHKSYMTSTWNGGIEPWNFGYDTWWGGKENIKIGYEDNVLNGHIFSDRILYLPGEEVNFKAIVRKANDLSIPKDQKFTISVMNPSYTEVFKKEFLLNDFGSFTDKFKLAEDTENGYYSIFVSKNGEENFFASYNFSVETFKKPKVKTEISLQTFGLNGEFVEIQKTEDSKEYFGAKNYLSKFSIKANISSKYYNSAPLSNKDFTYKVFRQQYFGDDFWDDCFYGCFWGADKEFYTSGTGKLDENGKASFDINVDFSSNYYDYKYIVEVSLSDDAGEEITSSNSVLAKLPDSLKGFNPSLGLHFNTLSSFVKASEKFKITGGLQKGKWSDSYNNNYIFIVKRKHYTNKKVTDSNGFERNIASQKEILENIFFVNDKNFKVNSDGKIETEYSVSKTGEYVFYYGALDKNLIAKYLKIDDPTKLTNQDIQKVFDIFEKSPNSYLNYEDKYLNCNEYKENENYLDRGEERYKCISEKINIYDSSFGVDDLISSSKSFSLVSYDKKSTASNPILDDNKLIVLSDKVSYKIGETAKILVRLPVSKSRIMITREIDNIKKTEVEDVEGNIFFKEFVVDESFAPNSYIGIFMIDLESKVPEYKVGYAEVVIDKTDKKAEIELKTDKEVYSPRDEVKLDLNLKDSKGNPLKSEVTVMVVDDSLISLMGNINPNTLEFIYKKFPFLTQTSMSNIAMLRNYYFSRKGLVGGSGNMDLKGGDSAVSTRNIFKNTAYFGNVVTDENGKASIKFNLPDNLTSFRVMALSNSKNNFFGYFEKFIEVKKSVSLEDKTPFIFRDGDKSEIGAIVTNNSPKDLNLKVYVKTDKIEIKDNIKNIFLKSGESKYVSFDIEIKSLKQEKLKYVFSAIGESAELSDKIEKEIEIKQNPILITNHQTLKTLSKSNPLDFDIEIPENTDLEKTKVELSFANNRIIGVENILKSLENEPDFYSLDDFNSKLQKNIILAKFSKFFKSYDEKKAKKEIESALKNLLSFQDSSGGFSYYEGWAPSYYLTNLILESFLDLKEMGFKLNEDSIKKALNYLENIYKEEENKTLYDNNKKAEIFYILSKYGREVSKNFDENILSRYALIKYTYALSLDKDKNREQIDKNISFIDKSFSKKIDRKNFYSWDKYLEKSLFTSLLFDLNDEKYTNLIDSYISDLYEQDWTNYYFSNETRNSTLLVFAKYLERNYKNNNSSFGFSIGNHGERGYKSLNKDVSILKYEYNLGDILKGDKLNFKALAQTDSPIYVVISIKKYPKDKTKIKEFSNKITLKKEIFEVVNEDKLLFCQNNPKDKTCLSILKKVENSIFEKGKTYKTKISIKSENPDIRNQIILQDYLASGIQVLNSKFTSVSSNFKTDDNWEWFNVQKNANLIQAVTYTDSQTLEFEYYFKALFSGKFNSPSAIIKELYNPDRNANSDYKIIEIK
ncbi:hypothetical protein DLH72_01895 [Candidatus Gracilibacteria bacterium]|nr:MAG: hypothetical protein DLH72_01895 [Candidatus Gracilibacteria bacterium]